MFHTKKLFWEKRNPTVVSSNFSTKTQYLDREKKKKRIFFLNNMVKGLKVMCQNHQ